jgi:hypothetical protein
MVASSRGSEHRRVSLGKLADPTAKILGNAGTRARDAFLWKSLFVDLGFVLLIKRCKSALVEQTAGEPPPTVEAIGSAALNNRASVNLVENDSRAVPRASRRAAETQGRPVICAPYSSRHRAGVLSRWPVQINLYKVLRKEPN